MFLKNTRGEMQCFSKTLFSYKKHNRAEIMQAFDVDFCKPKLIFEIF